MKYKVITFYKYINIENPEKLRDSIKDKCEELKILGRLLIGKEGINCGCCGELENIKKLQEFIELDKRFSDITYREHLVDKNVYHKLIVRVRDEIVAFGVDVDVNKTSKHIEPRDLQNMYENNEDFIIIDARNEYEAEVGKFKNAIIPPIKSFRDFPEWILKLNEEHKEKGLGELKEKKVVMYCTGGIRCEKASAYMKQNGFNDVSQINGGIINYCKEFGDNWEGNLFVFDDRLVEGDNEPISKCHVCGKKDQHVVNCRNLDCNQIFISCLECQKKYNECCSEKCKNSKNQRIDKEIEIDPFLDKKNIGEVINYYAKAKVACVKLEDKIKINEDISILGKTTNFEQNISELRDENGNMITEANPGEIVTFPVLNRVRQKDKIMI